MTPEKRYPSDLTDEEWVVVEECLRGEDEMGAGRPLEVDLRPPDYPHLFFLYIQHITWNLVLI
jgi:hypothetical protein